jgi:multiple antibiotic resistance protein
MVVTAVVTALVLFAFGALLMRLLHITGGAVAVGGGIILAILAINMVSGPGKKIVDEVEALEDPKRIAVYPLAVPYLLNPVGMTANYCLVRLFPSERRTCRWAVLWWGVRLFDLANIDKLANVKPTSLSRCVRNLLTAVAVQCGKRTVHRN